jgi:hypothetical protein
LVGRTPITTEGHSSVGDQSPLRRMRMLDLLEGVVKTLSSALIWSLGP